MFSKGCLARRIDKKTDYNVLQYMGAARVGIQPVGLKNLARRYRFMLPIRPVRAVNGETHIFGWICRCWFKLWMLGLCTS
jgi:hypothetical protein